MRESMLRIGQLGKSASLTSFLFMQLCDKGRITIQK